MELTLIDSGATTAEQLKQFADRMENLLNEIDGLKSDLKDLKGEAKSAGFNIKALDRLVAIRRKDFRRCRNRAAERPAALRPCHRHPPGSRHAGLPPKPSA